MKTCHLAHNSSVECNVATTMLRCTAWLQSIEMILIVSCVQILSLTSMRFRLIQNNLFPVSSLSGQSSSRIHWDPPCPLHSGRVQPPSQSPFSWMNQEHNEAWWVWFIFILWIIIPITLSRPAINGASEGRRRQTVQFDCSHLCLSWFCSHQWKVLSSDKRITFTDRLLLRKTLWARDTEEVVTGTGRGVKWAAGQWLESGVLRQESQG